MNLEEVRAEYERIHHRWRFAGVRERERDFTNLQVLFAHVQSLSDEDSESLEVEIEDLLTQIASRIGHDYVQRDCP